MTIESQSTKISIAGLQGMDLFPWMQTEMEGRAEFFLTRSSLRFSIAGKPLSGFACNPDLLSSNNIRYFQKSQFFNFFPKNSKDVTA
jgi:hypothetical protein